MKTDQERHQFCFSFMRSDTGGQKTKTFWAAGNEAESLEEARKMAERQRCGYENELNDKAESKARARGDRFRPSRIQVQIVGRSMWQ